MNDLLRILPLREPTFVESGRLAWLLAVGVIALLASFALIGRAGAIRRYFDRAPLERFAGLLRERAAIAALALSGAALAMTVAALARPAHDPKPRPIERTGRDVVFVLDVSRSMLAQDLRPSRLARAKLAVSDVLDVVEGDRIGLVAFAGTAVVKSPLSTDYSFVRMQLDQLTPDSVSRGGTAIGEAVRTALMLMFAESAATGTEPPARSRTIFLLTDGEDLESRPLQAAEQAGEKGVRLVTIGLGSESGSLLPIGAAGGAGDEPAPSLAPNPATRGTFFEHRGEAVRSRLDALTLREMAEKTPGGAFINVGTGNVELDSVYRRLMRGEATSKLGTRDATTYSELFQIALGLALLALCFEGVMHVRRAR